MPYEDALIRLARLGDPQMPPNISADTVESWWHSSALAGYAEPPFDSVLDPTDLSAFRKATWYLLDRSARLTEAGEQALDEHLTPPCIKAAALVGSIARGEASHESDADWNVLLDDRQFGTTGLAPLNPSSAGTSYCRQLAWRDKPRVRDVFQFDQLIGNLSRRGYTPKPSDSGTARERLRGFVERELFRPFPDYPRTGMATPVLTASVCVNTTGDGPQSWADCRNRVRLAIEPKQACLALICQLGEKLHRLSRLGSSRAAARHAAHGIMTSVTQSLLILQHGRMDVVAPYWQAPLLLRSENGPCLSDQILCELAVNAYLVARCRAERKPPAEDLVEQVASSMESALDEAGPGGFGWLTQAELDAARQALRRGEAENSPCRYFCR